MRIHLLCHAFDSLSQRLYRELGARGHQLSIEFDITDSVAEEVVALFRPELILAPYLRRAIPASIWQQHLCLIVHLMGGRDFWSNGIELQQIEAHESPADDSCVNINAIDDLAEAVIRTENHLSDIAGTSRIRPANWACRASACATSCCATGWSGHETPLAAGGGLRRLHAGPARR